MHEYSSWPIRLTSAQHCPNNPGIFVRQRHRGDVLVAPRDQALQPFTKTDQDAPPLAVGRNERSWGGLDAHAKMKGRIEWRDGVVTSSA